MSDQLVLHNSKPKIILGIFGLAILIVVNIGLGILFLGEGEVLIGIVSIIAGILVGIISVNKLPEMLKKGPRIIIDKYGIKILALNDNLIPWEDIEEVFVGEFSFRYSSQRYIGMKFKLVSSFVRTPSWYDLLASEANSVLQIVRFSESESHLRIVPNRYNVSFEKIWAHIRHLKYAHSIPVFIQEIG